MGLICLILNSGLSVIATPMYKAEGKTVEDLVGTTNEKIIGVGPEVKTNALEGTKDLNYETSTNDFKDGPKKFAKHSLVSKEKDAQAYETNQGETANVVQEVSKDSYMKSLERATSDVPPVTAAVDSESIRVIEALQLEKDQLDFAKAKREELLQKKSMLSNVQKDLREERSTIVAGLLSYHDAQRQNKVMTSLVNSLLRMHQLQFPESTYIHWWCALGGSTHYIERLTLVNKFIGTNSESLQTLEYLLGELEKAIDKRKKLEKFPGLAKEVSVPKNDVWHYSKILFHRLASRLFPKLAP
ncbi:hypothetical protein CROQUDRAFT_106104 [Cronartium quercuum f. sp. fusiforme G11]|uniref:Uncharacterized protein n=1 Tax=Cronartium quercuum f. sp. fusiforme G11 TaxID=708437 RepID=A0A9P6TEM5_9BASI|nr:hypothetical protein CROQUDRAFT_106104 [Cronartium quercuum f. sp. fusiforme G11]